MASTNIFMPHLWTSCPIRKISFLSNREKYLLCLQFHVLSYDGKTVIWKNSVDFHSYHYSAYLVVCWNGLLSPRPFLYKANLSIFLCLIWIAISIWSFLLFVNFSISSVKIWNINLVQLASSEVYVLHFYIHFVSYTSPIPYGMILSKRS